MLTIKEYAKQHNVSYEAIRAQIKRNTADFEGHIIKKGRTQYLDEVAEELLNARRASNPIIAYDQAKDIRIEELERQNEDMKVQIQEMLGTVTRQKDDYIKLQAENARLLALPGETEKKLAVAETELKNVTERVEELKSDLASKDAMITNLTEDNARQQKEIREEYMTEINRLNEELRKEAAKTWWQKLWHK